MKKKVLSDLRKLKPFAQVPGRAHDSFVGISSNPLNDLDETKFSEWLTRHQKNIAMHFPTAVDLELDADTEGSDDLDGN